MGNKLNVLLMFKTLIWKSYGKLLQVFKCIIEVEIDGLITNS